MGGWVCVHRLCCLGGLAADLLLLPVRPLLSQGRPLTPSHFPNDPGLWDETLDLTPYINTSAIRVPESYTLERAYILFSTMGLRHLVVVDEHNRVRVRSLILFLVFSAFEWPAISSTST